ncbi:MAG: chromate transporter [Erysipelotrichaceae bacterium]|nr:chromate transporter [Erysipelotrichaceae bacterium]
MSIWLSLIIEFFKTGLFAVGGGLATVPFLQQMGVKYGWFDSNMLSTMIAVSESTPGPIGINMATYVGYLTGGVLGGIVTTLSLVAPSIIVICIIAKMLDKFKSSKIVQEIFFGIRPAVVGFIAAAVSSIFISTLLSLENSGIQMVNWINVVIYAIMYGLYKKFKLNPILVIVSCGVIGVLLQL